ncbi:unnamed protein product [Leptosia nina]|uniref:Uncharacterized protein n=1 Tax=Leptosia nina TaxID=320188 RepID=A0AAV1JCS3_9NEOP
MAPCDPNKVIKRTAKHEQKQYGTLKKIAANGKPEEKTMKTPLKVVDSNLKPAMNGAVPKPTTRVIKSPKTVKKVTLKRCSIAPSPLPSIKKKPDNSAQKLSLKRRQLPAHSGVPVPDKMKNLKLQLLDIDFYN